MTILRWEKGKRNPGKRDLSEILEKTGIPPRELRPDWAEMLEAAE